MKAVHAILVGGLLLPTLCHGAIPDGLLCDECHTMHNSQGGLPMTTSGDRNPMLLRSTCLGCHTGTNSSGGTKPFVFSTTEPNYGGASNNSLAGGNFYWVVNGNGTKDPDRLGHNVIYLHATDGVYDFSDSDLATPPGYSGGSWTASTLTCAGPQGCHGLRDPLIADETDDLAGAHHAADTPPLDGSTVAKSYRFLKGIKGVEDDDWEYDTTPDYNIYQGADRASSTIDSTTISSLCAKCHGNFHNGAGNIEGDFFETPWLRHPTDYDFSGLSTVSYGTYTATVPIAYVDSTTTPSKKIVMCLSCHRAHGSPNEGLLRWDYRAWPLDGGVINGCAVCHTTKD